MAAHDENQPVFYGGRAAGGMALLLSGGASIFGGRSNDRLMADDTIHDLQHSVWEDDGGRIIHPSD